MRRIKYGKFGLAENPIGYHVALTHAGQDLLGEVVGITRSPVTGSIGLKVRHFCGDMWPIEPCAAVVKVLE